MNMLATTHYQPKLSSMTNVAPGGSVNQIAVLHQIKVLRNNLYILISSANFTNADEVMVLTTLKSIKIVKNKNKTFIVIILIINFHK
jgi:hypothetical protein